MNNDVEEKVDHHPQQQHPPLSKGQPVSAANYRLSEVERLQDQLKAEAATRTGLYRNYHRSISVLDSIDIAASATGVILSGVVATIAAPVAPSLWALLPGAAFLALEPSL